MQLVSINIAATAKALSTGDKIFPTGIFKQPVTGQVAVSTLGLEGDTIVDTTVHGGEDQALYLYSAQDYAWWSDQLGRQITPGTFGENLTISAFPAQPLKIGDRLTVGESLLLEITAPRVPCVKFATRMNDPAFGKKFVAAVRPGAYARVLNSATIQTGDKVHWQQTDQDYAFVNDVFVQWHNKDWSEAVFRKALASPVSRIARTIIEERFIR